MVLATASVSAQTWSARRERPALFEIIAVDPSAQPGWPFGSEDVAADGAQTFQSDEAAVDLRSIYADARANRLWVRVYTAATEPPAMNAVAFMFLDTDARAGTGGPAEGMAVWPAFEDDPSSGGYERAVGLRGDGTLVGVYAWDATERAWMRQPERPQQTRLETGVSRDPLRLAGDDHAYFQVELDLPAFELDDACDGTIFVRLWNDGTGARRFGDATTAGPCKPRLNRFGDPDVLQTATCDDDDSCPARGDCRDGTCVFAYECSQNAECRAGERCEGDVCVRVVETMSCDGAADCDDGTVCVSGQCTTCRDSGARACAEGLVCTPRGSCIRPSDGEGGGGTGGRGEADGGDGPQVRGGAFTCSAGPLGRAGKHGAWLGLGVALMVALRRRAARRRGAR